MPLPLILSSSSGPQTSVTSISCPSNIEYTIRAIVTSSGCTEFIDHVFAQGLSSLSFVGQIEMQQIGPPCEPIFELTLDMRYIFDQSQIGLVLIDMPGFEKRLSRYSQLSSRIGFVHKYGSLRAEQVRDIWQKLWQQDISRPKDVIIENSAMTDIIRTTRGNFRLLDRLLTQISRILEINDLSEISEEVVEVARENLVIG